MRGWMFSWPGVAMNSATSPSFTRFTMRWPIANPDANRSWPMYASLSFGLPAGTSALYASTGMPLESAEDVGALNALRSTRQQEIPAALAEIAELNAFTISLTLDVVEPVHW